MTLTHFLLTVSTTLPAGHPQPGTHSLLHFGNGLEQVAGQGAHFWYTCPIIGQPVRYKNKIFEHYTYFNLSVTRTT